MRTRSCKNGAIIGLDESYGAELKPWQTRVAHAVFEGGNVLAVAPTGSGKSHLALSLCLRFKRVLWVLPTKALTREWFMRAYRAMGSTRAVNIYTGDYRRETPGFEGEIVFATYESAVLQLRRRDPWFSGLELLVFDEFQFVGEEERGGVVEELLILVSEFSPSVRLLALSATISNPTEVANWLSRLFGRPSAVHVLPASERPVRLSQYALKFRREEEKRGYLMELIRSNRDKQFLVFTPRRVEAENLAKYFSARGVRAAVHHAGLDRLSRVSSEERFRQGEAQVLFCTATLQFGVNLPAHFVVIYDPVWDTKKGEFRLSANDYLQMAGRAGRPINSPVTGESIVEGKVVVLTTGSAEYMFARSHLINTDAEPIVSSFEHSLVQRVHGLLLYRDEEDIRRLLTKSFARLDSKRIAGSLRALRAMKFLSEGSLTRLGRFVAELNLDPFAASRFIDALQGWWSVKSIGPKVSQLVFEEVKKESSSMPPDVRSYQDLLNWEFVYRRHGDGHLLVVNYSAPQALRDRAAWYMYSFERIAEFLGRRDQAESIMRERMVLEGMSEADRARGKLLSCLGDGKLYIEIAVRDYDPLTDTGRGNWLGLEVSVRGAPRGWSEPVLVKAVDEHSVMAERRSWSTDGE